MREYLEKKEITGSVKPVYNMLWIVELGLFLIAIIAINTSNNLDHLFWIVIMLQVLVSSAIVKLGRFDEAHSLTIMPKIQKRYSKYRYDIPMMPTLLILFGIVLLCFNIIAIGISLIAIGLFLVIFIISKKH